MAALLTLDVAKDHLRIRTTDQDNDLVLKLDQASSIILSYLDTQAVAGWTTIPQTVTPPDNVIAATLYVFEDLYERRPVNFEMMRALLTQLRDPALA